MTTAYVRGPAEAAAVDADVVFQVGTSLFTGEDDFTRIFESPTSLETDLLLIASSIFATDRAVPRGSGDDYPRRVTLSIPVVNGATLSPLVPLLERILRFLSNDSWRLQLRQIAGAPEAVRDNDPVAGATLLFSGGLDSLAAAIDFGSGGALQLVSHRTRNARTGQAQRELVQRLRDRGMPLTHYQLFVSSSDRGLGTRHDIENTQRTRSLLFLILAGLCARRMRHREILYLAENGQMAINLPLTRARIGAFSTHTAHPQFISLMQDFLSRALGTGFVISNPYVYRTKAEVTRSVVVNLPDCVPISTSCWRNARLPADFSHCGECVPCLVRRIAIEYLCGSDPTAYVRDAWAEPIAKLAADDEARRNTVELASFVMMIEASSNEDIMSEWPDLYSRYMDGASVIEMYRRFAAEARGVMRQYETLAPLLQ
jgi:7-cyano-7-deazaguanine synthase in queuosine biosynthesis